MGLIDYIKRTFGAIVLKKYLLDFYEIGLTGVVIADFDSGYIEYANDAFLRGLGYTLEEIRAKPSTSFIHDDDLAKTQKVISDLLVRPVVYNFTNRYRKKDGRYISVTWTAALRRGKYICKTDFEEVK